MENKIKQCKDCKHFYTSPLEKCLTRKCKETELIVNCSDEKCLFFEERKNGKE